MKAIFTLLLAFSVSFMMAQDKVFVHTATAGNISGNVTYLDHPDLNGNPSANIIITHNLSNGGTQYNNKVSGSWYDGAQWTVFNEDVSAVTEGSSYNIYIPIGGKLITEQADGSDYTHIIDDVAINNNPNAVIVYSTYWNPSGVYNNTNYGFWYQESIGRWNIYNEDLGNIPTNAVFALLVDEGTGGGNSFVHTATAGNTVSNYTIIDHPSLNGKPEAYPVIAHNWGNSAGEPANIIMDVTLGVWYNGSNWTIYTEDTSSMVVDTKYNVYVAEEFLGTEDETIENLTYFPNPVESTVTVSAQSEITSITVFDVLGKQVFAQEGSSNSMVMDLSALASGNYMARVQSQNNSEVIKLVKI